MTTYGNIVNYQTGEDIRKATREELAKSLAAGHEGVFKDEDGTSVYCDGSADALACDAEEDAVEIEIIKNEDGVVGARRNAPIQSVDATASDVERIASLCATYGVVVHYDPSTQRFEVTYV